LSLEEQQKWVAKMQGFDFEIIYKKGKDNVVANSLSIIEEASKFIFHYIFHSYVVGRSFHEWKEDNSTRQKNTMSKRRE
jgi:hypothetical protein